METQFSVGGCLEIRQRGAGRSLSGSFPYGKTATVRDRGRVRKETFRQGAFSWQLREFARVTSELNIALGEIGDELILPRAVMLPSWRRGRTSLSVLLRYAKSANAATSTYYRATVSIAPLDRLSLAMLA